LIVDLHLAVEGRDIDSLLALLTDTLLDGVALVDFDRFPAPELAQALTEAGYPCFVGMQVRLARGALLAFPASADLQWIPPASPRSDEELIASLKQAGCALVACHPYHRVADAATGDGLIQVKGIEAILAVAGQSAQAANDLALDLVEKMALPAVGGTGNEGSPGKAATLFAERLTSQADLVAQIRARACWAVAIGAEDRWASADRAPRPERDDRRREGRGRRDEGRGRRDGRGGDRREGRRGGRRDGRRDGRGDGRRQS